MERKITLKLISLISALVFVLTAFPFSAFAEPTGESEYYDEEGTYVIELQVGDEADFATYFNRASDRARYSEDGTRFKIIVPAGTYDVNSQLRLYSNTTAVFDGVTLVHSDPDSTMLRLGRKGDDWDDYDDGKGHPGYSGFTNIAVEGGSFNGGGYSQAIMRFGHSQNISIKNATFTNVKNAHLVEFGACSDVNVENCKFLNFTGDWSSSTNYEALQFDALAGNHFSAYNPINDETPCKNVTVKGCTFKNLERGLGTHTGVVNSYFNNMVYQNNTFENITGYAIIATNYTNSKINNNTIKNCGSGIYFRTMEPAHKNFYASKTHSNSRSSYNKLNSQIMNNNITVTPGYKANFKNVGYGIQLYGEKLSKGTGSVTAGDFRCANVTVQKNTINLNCTGYAIWATGAVKNSIKSNKIYCNIVKKATSGAVDGIRLAKSSSNTISSNSIVNKTSKGYDSSLNGINLNTSSTSNTVTSNKVSKVKKDGIHVEKSKNNTVKGNTIATAGRDGVHVDGGSVYNISSNKISKAKRDGIFTSGATKLTLVSNTITSCKRYGMSAKNKKAIKKDSKNKIKKCKKARNWKK